jgi:hypothetical protein
VKDNKLLRAFQTYKAAEPVFKALITQRRIAAKFVPGLLTLLCLCVN